MVRFKKEWQMMDGTTKTVIWWTGKGIVIDPDGIRIGGELLGSGDILGTTEIYV